MLYDRARLGSDACEVQRKILHDDRKRKQSEFVTDASNTQSIVSTMERFVKAVNEMNDHVILPTKLLDPEEESRGASADVPVMLRGRGNTRYDFYHCLNSIKKDLVLGVSSNDEEDSDDSHTDSGRTSPYKVLSTTSFHQQSSQNPTRRHSTACIPNQTSQPSENLPTRKISLNFPPYTESGQHNVNRQDNSGAVNLVQRQDSWASLNTLPEEQPSRKSGWASVNAIPEYHRQVLSSTSLRQQTPQHPTRRHSTACIPNQMFQPCENLPTRKNSLNVLPYTENSLHNVTQDNSASVNLVQRQDSWASLNPLPEEQPSRKSNWAAVNVIPEYHSQVTYDSGAESDEIDPDQMSPMEIAEQLREHLQGLHIGFSHLADTAKYITKSIE